MTLAHIVILGVGVVWLALLVGWPRALALGLKPFGAATIVKTLLAAWTLPATWRLLERMRK
jgi:biotin transport system substrate-specific component